MIYFQIILQAGILGVLVIGGLWLRDVVNQQLKLKDEQIKTLQASADHAKQLAAPNIIADLKEVSGYANSTAGQNRELRGMVDQINEELENMKEDQTQDYLKGLRAGFIEGTATMHLAVDNCIKGEVASNDAEALKALVIDLIVAMEKAQSSLAAKADMIKRGEFPNLDQMEALILLIANQQEDQ